MRTRSLALALPLLFSAQFVQADPLPVVDISLSHDEANGLLTVYLRANEMDFGEVVSNLVFTIRWSDTSPATLGLGSSDWCPAPNQALPLSPLAMVTPGNGFHYRTYNSLGFVMLSAIQDDGGCAQSLLADTWIPVYTIPVNNDPGGTAYEITNDQYAIDNNRLYYISLNGSNQTGDIYTISTDAPEAERTPSAPTLELSPNPTPGLLYITLPEEPSDRTFAEVIDATGKLVRTWRLTAQRSTADLSGLHTGAYVMRITDNAAVRTAPLVIERP